MESKIVLTFADVITCNIWHSEAVEKFTSQKVFTIIYLTSFFKCSRTVWKLA